MLKRFGLGFLALAIVGAMFTISGCGDAEANPCRWNLDKIELPEKVVEASEKSESNLVVLDFYAKGSDEIAFSRDYELAPGQTEIEVGEIPADLEYDVKGSLYADGSLEAVAEF